MFANMFTASAVSSPGSFSVTQFAVQLFSGLGTAGNDNFYTSAPTNGAGEFCEFFQQRNNGAAGHGGFSWLNGDAVFCVGGTTSTTFGTFAAQGAQGDGTADSATGTCGPTWMASTSVGSVGSEGNAAPHQRAYSAATIANSQIYFLGGQDASGALTMVERMPLT